MNILGCLGMFVFGIFFFLFAVLRIIYIAAFGNKKHQSTTKQHSGGKPHTSPDGSYKKPNRPSGDNRIYPDSVGEYVPFEEVND